MDDALTMLVLWALLFVPVGLALHGLVLGEAARIRALPLAPITGLATAFVLLSVLARAGVEAGDGWVAWMFAGISFACVLLVWRCGFAWRSRELIGAGLLLVLAIFLVQLPVVGSQGDGPLGYGTVANPVEEVAAINAAVGGKPARQDVARQAAGSAHDRPIAFEQFAALTVSLGYDRKDTSSQPSWTAYSLHAALTGMLAALVALPLFAFARARGVRWFGLVFLVPVGVLAPYTFLALANGSGAAVATVPMYAAAVFSLLVTRRDRGWWSLTMIFGSAIAATAGALAILPLLTVGIAWIFLRATAYEHLAQADAPVGRVRALAPGVIAAVLAIAGVASTLATGALLAWPRLHVDVLDALRSWPFAWLGTNLSTAGPEGPVETAVWLAGPVLLFIAAVHGVIRNERRELAVLLGAIASAFVGLIAMSVNRAQGIRIYEYTILVASPLLAALAVRGVALAREHAQGSVDRGRIARIAGWGPAVLIVGFVVVSVAATAVVGTRMVHAPALKVAAIEKSPSTLVAGGDQWLAFVVQGTRIPGGYADPDALATKAGNSVSTNIARAGFPLGRWHSLVISNSPLGSDPPTRFGEEATLDSYQARLFYDNDGREPNNDVAQELTDQRSYTSAAEEAAKATNDATAPSAKAGASSTSAKSARTAGTSTQPAPTSATSAQPAGDASLQPQRPLRHDPVEGAHTRIRPDAPAGLLVPQHDVRGCDDNIDTAAIQTSGCGPKSPDAGSTCTKDDVTAARSPLEDAKDRTALPSPAPTGTQIVNLLADPVESLTAPARLIGVQCFDVEIAPNARLLSLHVRNVGLILAPERAAKTGRKSAWRTTGAGHGAGDIRGGVREVTSLKDATISYGGNRLTGRFDITPEGTFGAGVNLESGPVATAATDGTTTTVQGLPPVATIRGAAQGFGQITRDVSLSGSVVFRNSSGTNVEFGRVFARPRGLPQSCDFVLPIASHAQRELRTESNSSDLGHYVQRPGLTVTINEARGSGGDRTAHVVVGSYLSFAGLARYALLDWTEQYDAPVTYEGCDADHHTEQGAPAAAGGAAAKLNTKQATKGLAHLGN